MVSGHTVVVSGTVNRTNPENGLSHVQVDVSISLSGYDTQELVRRWRVPDDCGTETAVLVLDDDNDDDKDDDE